MNIHTYIYIYTYTPLFSQIHMVYICIYVCMYGRSDLPAQWSVEFVNQPGIIGPGPEVKDASSGPPGPIASS